MRKLKIKILPERTVERLSEYRRTLFQCLEEDKSHIYSHELADIHNIDLFVFTHDALYRPFEWNRAVLDQMKNSGALREIENQRLARKISEYDALTRHLDQDYSNDEEIIRQATNEALRVVNVNYPAGAIFFDRPAV